MRYLVLRKFRHSKDLEYFPGQFLEAETIKDLELSDKMTMHVRRALVIDSEFEYDIRSHERGLHRRRIQCLREIGTEESEKFLDLAITSYEGKVTPKTFEYVTGLVPSAEDVVETLIDESQGEQPKDPKPKARKKRSKKK